MVLGTGSCYEQDRPGPARDQVSQPAIVVHVDRITGMWHQPINGCRCLWQ